jgi:DNA mismatch repair ATPase MutS
VLWQEQLAISFEKWRAESGPYVGDWIHAVAEFEALSSFAALAFERPAWTMPQLSSNTGAAFEATALNHPLLPAAVSVPNDLSLNGEHRMLIVSGSNMSGKSTLLRAVGLNSVLAWAGGPVAASALRISELRIGASIRITDSLQDHRSRFLAEITRIRQIVDLTRTGEAVLFLLDELLSGTNSHDRRIGAAGIVKELLRSNSIGLITTHDLALANIQQDVRSGVANVHFEDHMNGTEMLFDYKLKPGVVARSNAIELMRAVGLNV